ncbi:MAG: UvrD-helicase domain-containing protein [Chromatiales bacterium]|jgi:ATP-dependent exoDNAse (exonuclease V) beta subunit
MTDAIADQQQRLQALDVSHSCIVQAPAGSGKTELISQRFLKLLAICERPEAVLAITFTRKAASEMRQRIVAALQSASQAEPQEPHKQLTWSLAKQALAQDERQDWQLLHNPSRLRVVTIDSFCSSLTRQMPLLSQMGSAASPVEDASALYLEAARRTLAELESSDWSNDVARLMAHLGNQVERIQQLLTSMLARRDQWLRHIADSQDQRLQRNHLEQALSHLVQDHLQSLTQLLPAGFVDEASALLQYAATHVDADKKPDIALWHEQAGFRPESLPEHLPYWLGLADLLLTDNGDVRKQPNKNIGIPAPSSSKDADTKAWYQQHKDRLQQLLAELEQQPELVQALARLRSMPALNYSDDQWLLLQSLIRVLLLAAAHLRIVFAEQGSVDFAEIALSANRALGDEQQPTDLALAMDYRLQHILVDEFQDTSQGQFELLEKLTRGWQADDGRTLFLVGDPMQSIYRFREAEVGLYLKARQQGIGEIHLRPLYLSVNFRSQQGIVDWVNRSLAQTFPTQEDISSGAVSYSPCIAAHALEAGPAITVHPQLERDDTREAEQVLGIVQQALQQHSGSIAILVRSRNHLPQIIEQLKTANIGFQALDLDLLIDKGSVIDLYSLTMALHHAGDRLHWLALLRAPWCGLTLNDLLVIADAGPTVWRNCLQPEVQQRLSNDGRQRLRALIDRLQPFLLQRYRMSLRQWLAAIWQGIGGAACYAGQTDQQDAINSYLELLDAHDQGGRITDFVAFNDALAKLYAPVDQSSDGRVQIMTMHKSKGLEFDVVILPGLGKRARGDESTLLDWLERPSREAETDLLIAPIKASENASDEAIGKSLKAINNDKAAFETTRLLYVAATRARQRLHLLGHTKKNRHGFAPESRSLLATLWPVVAQDFEALESDRPRDAVESLATGKKLLRRLPAGWSPTSCSALPVQLEQQQVEETVTDLPDPEFDWATETARHIGTITHRYLQRMACQPRVDWNAQRLRLQQRNAIRTGLRNLGTVDDDLEMACDKVIQALINTIEDERGRWILQPHSQASCEYALTHKSANGLRRYILDRTFIDAQGRRWIIDYKSGSHAGTDVEQFLDQEQQRYREQLQQYGRLMQQLGERDIHLGLYFPLLNGWREWRYATETD